MGEWITGAAINVVGSVSINFGTNLLKLGHNQVRKKNAFFAKICFSSLANLSFAAVVFRNLRLGFFFQNVVAVSNFCQILVRKRC
jgi:hypothetical protein